MFEQLHARFNDAETRIILGPSWAHGSTPSFLRRAKARADALGKIPIHIHTLQTPHQRAYGEWKYGKSLVAMLDEHGLVDENLVLGHSIYATEADIERLGAARAAVTHHPSCNFNMRNGIAPIPHVLKAGVTVALGLDDKGINDLDEILDDPWWSGDLDIAEMFVHRAKGHHVASVGGGGKIAIEDRAFKTVDVPALWAEVRKVAARGLPAQQAKLARLMRDIKPHAQAWYARWQKSFGEPYYRVNARN